MRALAAGNAWWRDPGWEHKDRDLRALATTTLRAIENAASTSSTRSRSLVTTDTLISTMRARKLAAIRGDRRAQLKGTKRTRDH